jgi:hypothetical protein
MQPRVDDPSIGDDALLWRDIPPVSGWFHRNPDGSLRPSSMAFLDGLSRELSVHLASETTEAAVLNGRNEFSIAEIRAGCPRSLGYAVVRDPEPEDPSHTIICPPPQIAEKRRKKDARAMALQARFVIMRAPESVLPPAAEGGSAE